MGAAEEELAADAKDDRARTALKAANLAGVLLLACAALVVDAERGAWVLDGVLAEVKEETAERDASEANDGNSGDAGTSAASVDSCLDTETGATP